MNDLSNYYQRNHRNNENTASGRFPGNHVKFSALLKPLQLIDRACGIFGSTAFRTMDAMLKEFDSATPIDTCLGTKEELMQVRKLIVSYCDGIDNNPFLSSIGRFLIQKISLEMLKKRKAVLEYYHSNKAHIDTNGKFKAPVIITGLPRSGSTLLHRLMSEDPLTRSPYTFEMEIPTPPMTSSADPLMDSRIKNSAAAISTLSRLASGFMEKLAESHLWSATEAEESLTYMLVHNGVNVMNKATAGKAYLHDLYKIEGKLPIFRYERLFFTMLDAYRPAKSHWTLKAPIYAPYFPLIFEAHPDARVIVTHRNPIVTLPSYCRLMESWCITTDRNGSFDKYRFGQFEQDYIDKSLLVPLEYRKKHPEQEDRIFDCMYDALFSDPIAMVEKIYRKFDLEYTKEFGEKMKIYLEKNKQGKYGRHKYSLEEYGFDADTVFQNYSEYMEQYNFTIPDKVIRPTSFDFSLESGEDVNY